MLSIRGNLDLNTINVRTLFLLLGVVLLCVGCSKDNSSKNLGEKFSVGNRLFEKIPLGDSHIEVISEDVFKNQVNNGDILGLKSKRKKLEKGLNENLSKEAGVNSLGDDDDLLIVGLPMTILGKDHLFGGNIVKAYSPYDSTLGILKGSGPPVMHVVLEVAKDSNSNYQLQFKSCLRDCAEGAPKQVVTALSIVGISDDSKVIYVDLSATADTFNMFKMDPLTARRTGYKSAGSKTIDVQYDGQYMVFNVASLLKYSLAIGSKQKEVFIVSRWFMEISKPANPEFKAVKPSPYVGFFKSEMNKSGAMANVRALKNPDGSDKKVKYFVKNVPEKYHRAFEESFAEWNSLFQELIGRDFLEYEFITSEKMEPTEEIVFSDLRYNVIEWDVENIIMNYSGYGPFKADPRNGEIISADVFIQGKVLELMINNIYKAQKKADHLREKGEFFKAELLLNEEQEKLNLLQNGHKQLNQHQLFWGALELTPVLGGAKCANEIDLQQLVYSLPKNLSQEEFIVQTLRATVTHELGHNLGLRHNFKGSLGASEESDDSGHVVELAANDSKDNYVTRSIMDYLDLERSYASALGDYDLMAMEFAYLSKEPQEKNWFCTDHQVFSLQTGKGSPECQVMDATATPFDYHQDKIEEIVIKLMAKSSKKLSPWTVQDFGQNFVRSIGNLSGFFIKTENVAEISSLFKTKKHLKGLTGAPLKKALFADFKKSFCGEIDPTEAVENKETEAIGQATLINVNQVVDAVFGVIVETFSEVDKKKLDKKCFWDKRN